MANDENKKKIAIIATALIGMSMSITFCAIWSTYLSVIEEPTFDCSVGDFSVSERWATSI